MYPQKFLQVVIFIENYLDSLGDLKNFLFSWVWLLIRSAYFERENVREVLF